ncbi:hypothetical protein [Streptomyces prasinus]|uniref:hypothetical protein n=1 Tax=Streptomyces prasinus TaxID=67345 RepID=UPI0036ACFD85
MPSYTSSEEASLEIFLLFIGKRLGELGATTMIDLYTDFPIDDERARIKFDELKQASSDGEGADPLMGVELDLTSDQGVQVFSLLGFRTIGCESFIEDKLVFTNIENECTVWLNLPEGELVSLEVLARQSGADGLTRIE